ncbi:SET and MYND domain-containing protein 4-like [Schistocerca serialis cubense]|uniref:SET and MYND domain-containing protein 4-like n=1 Tax=Schistocerca serialis cubense TaxID=2023355 RepID=UPI00214EF602|nr:SET and MYND domain-containing protein 4-like [Schistocerca serialis cubense]
MDWEPDAVLAAVRGLPEAAQLAEELAAMRTDLDRVARVLSLPCLADLQWEHQQPADTDEQPENDGDSHAHIDDISHMQAQLLGGRHAEVPCMSAALLVRRDPQRGLHLVAAQDIPAGSVLLVEEAFAWSLTAEALADHCTHCATPLRARVLPCPTCQQALFCSAWCRRQALDTYHRRECVLGLRSFLESPLLGCAALLALRTVFAEDRACDTDYSARRVRDQVTHAEQRTPNDFLRRAVAAACVGRRLLPAPEQRAEAEQLAGRLLARMQACSCNAYQLSEQLLASPHDKEGEPVELGGAVYPAVSLLNHACWPNVSRHTAGRACVVRASRPVTRGAELLDNYGPSFLAEDRDERLQQLRAQYFFTCTCTPCEQDWPLVHQLPPTRYKCPQCKKPIESNLTAVRRCPHCKKKVDFKKTACKIAEFSHSYREAVAKLLEGKFDIAIQLCAKNMHFLDPIVIHPSIDFLKCQQVLNQCWSLTGNTNVIQDKVL